MNYAARIDLGHEHEFLLGRLTVRPSVRQVADETGRSEIVEPRVMQVLVALARANGAILTRETLTELCWDGRIVGEDAINRVMSRLRRLAEGAGGGSFRIETITKVGYRLVETRPVLVEAELAPSAAASPPRPARAAPGRRAVLTGGILAGLGALGGGALLWGSSRPHLASAEVARTMELGEAALCKCDAEGIAEAIGFFRRAVEMDPQLADAWGLLAMSYAYSLRGNTPDVIEALRIRTRAAVARAFALDPVNQYAQEAQYSLIPFRGHWAEADGRYRAALNQHPNARNLLFGYGRRLAAIGRMSQSAQELAHAERISSPTPGMMFSRIWALWGSGALEEADRELERAFGLFPLHYAVWFTRFYVLMFTGRADQALRFGENITGRPPSIPPQSFDLPMVTARAMDTRAPADIDRAMRMAQQAARRGSGLAENAMHFASGIGRIDEAFAIADAYFFSRGFVVPDRRFDGPQKILTLLSERQTSYLFMPPAEAMRRDPRFEPLVRELGLDAYWSRSGMSPDYRRA